MTKETIAAAVLRKAASDALAGADREAGNAKYHEGEAANHRRKEAELRAKAAACLAAIPAANMADRIQRLYGREVRK